MSRTKTKRIVWTMAILLMLAFVAAMVLHKHAEPVIIGNLSKEDVSDISHVALRAARSDLRGEINLYFKRRYMKELIANIVYYPFVKVTKIEAKAPGLVIVTAKPRSGGLPSWYYLVKTNGEWKTVPNGFGW